MTARGTYKPAYSGSHALVIGINKYKYVGPLDYARHDAEAIANLMIHRFGFPNENVVLLLDEDATGGAVRSAFLTFASDSKVQPDDRVLVFFAGHGHTQTGRRGEIGFLVPVDGKISDLSTLIRWDELTRNADLICAKHIFFLMDACYGGLALSRKSIPPGSMRFLKDMLQRYSRQVLTAGKADEMVLDSGGPRPGHSIFTAHILDAFEGVVSLPSGVITANSIMAHAYEKVGNDPNSHQIPHFGFIEGDGDFIFDLAPIEKLSDDDVEGSDLLVELSPTSAPTPQVLSVSEMMKGLIPDASQQIKLDDFVSGHVRHVVTSLALRNFPPSIPITPNEVGKRLKQYEATVEDLITIVILLARWAERHQLNLIEKMFARLAEVDKFGNGGIKSWLRLGWYPIALLMYAGGIAALSAQRYDALKSIFLTRVHSDPNLTGGNKEDPLILPTAFATAEVHDLFKKLPGHEQQFVPMNEYLFKLLQPMLEDALFLGHSYETLFDRFEVLFALECSNIMATGDHSPWGPPGRFAWKHRRGRQDSPFNQLVEEANQQGGNWPLLKANFFNGSLARFQELAADYKDTMQKFPMR